MKKLITVTILVLCVTLSYAAEKGLVGYWKFDEGSGEIAKDSSGNGFDGTINGEAEWVKGVSGKAISLNGSSVIEIPFNEKLQLGEAISIQVWIYPTDYEPNTYKEIATMWDSFLLRFDSPPEGGKPSFFVFLDGTPEPRISGTVPEIAKWHQVVAVWDGKKSQIWIDGVKNESDRKGTPSLKQNSLKIGVNFVGAIDEVKIFNRALNEDEIMVLVPPKIKVASLKISNAILEIDKPFTLSCEVSNVGGQPAEDGNVELVLPEGLVLLEGEKKINIPSLKRKEPKILKWTLKSPSSLATDVSLITKFKGMDVSTTTGKVVVANPVPAEGDIFDKPTVKKVGEDFILGNNRVRLVFPKNGFGYGIFSVDANKNGKWARLAASNSFSCLSVKKGQDVIRKSVYSRQAVPITSESGKAGIEFKETISDLAGTNWNCRFSFLLSDDDRVKVEYEAVPDKDGSLVYLQGPTLYVGEGSFGSKKDDGLFCGLEWLVGDEVSSSNLDMHDPEYYIRFVPHPNKITIPLMAISKDGSAIALFWDALQKWDGKNIRPSAVFASPNFIEGKDNHIMGLFLPSVPEWVGQNKLEALENPYPFKKDVPLKIVAYITAVTPAKQSLDCLDRWFKTFGVTELAPLPRKDYIKEIEFSMRAYLESLWIASEQKWCSSKGWEGMTQKVLNPFFTFQLKLAAIMTKDDKLKKQFNERADLTAKLGGYSPYGDDMGFTWANPSGSLLGLAGKAGSNLDSMWEDGSWRFRTRIGTGFPFKGYDYGLLGPDKAAELGTCAWNAYEILKFVRMTGDAEVFKTVEKSLKFMEQFNVPRAAQVWECPVHTPDILAASDAMDAYIEAYRYTGDKHYLDEALRWAWAGLPFIYFWEEPGHYMMRYASIAIFGGTQYNGSWIGQPVQWNGLRYAYALLKLWDYDKSFPWKKVAEGITISAMYQQDVSGENVALWPDNFSAANGTLWVKCGWVFEPSMILKNVYKLLDRDLEPATFIVGTGKERLYINSRAKVSKTTWDGNKLKFEALFPEGENGYILIASIDKPLKVLLNGAEVSEAQKLWESKEVGWNYNLGQAFLTLKFVSPGPHTVEVEGAKYRLATLVPKQIEKIAFDFNKELEGWMPANQIENLTIEDGIMKGTATGGDPYMHRSRIKVDGKLYKVLKIKAKASVGDSIAIYWITEDSPDWSEDKAIHLKLQPDNQFHDYIFEVGKHEMWKGKTITGIRLDPIEGGTGGDFEVDYIKGEM